VGDHTTAARRCAAEFPDPCPTPSTFAILARTRIPAVIMIYVCEYAEVPLVWRQSHCSKIFRPRGRLHCLHCQRLCGKVNPTFGLRGYISEPLLTIAALLVDRSLGNLVLRRNNFFVICIKHQQCSYNH
jgi:hypothetical protein